MPNEDTTCALCGRVLSPDNRSKAQVGLCKMCAGEAGDPGDEFEIE